METHSEYILRLAKRIRNCDKKKFWKIYHKQESEDLKKTLILARCYYDFEFFIRFFFKEHVSDKEGKFVPFNEMAKDYFADFEPNEEKVQKVIRAARGSAKTTIVCLFDTMHRALYSTEKYIVLMSSTAPLSLDKIRDIKTEVLFNERIKEYFGVDFKNKRVSTESFTLVSRFGECKLKAQSFFSQIRGLKAGAQRPTRFVFDDVTHGERVFSEVQREKAKRQFNTDIKNAGQPTTNYIFVGTTIHKDDLVTELSQSPLWKASLYKAIKKWPKRMDLWDKWEQIILDKENPEREANAEMFYVEHRREMDKAAVVLWPEREPLIYLMKERLTIGRRAFGSEKQMQPFLSGESLFKDIWWYRFTHQDGKKGFLIERTNKFIELDERFQVYYALDPATGEKKTQTSQKSLSFSSRVVAYRDLKTNRKFINNDYTDRKSPSSIIRQMCELHAEHQFIRMGVEENLFKDLYDESIKLIKDKFEKEVGINIKLPIRPVWNSQEKENRIYGIEPKVTSGEILFNRHLSNEATTEIQDYPNCDHNDFLDAVEILEKITSSKYGLRQGHVKYI